MKIIIIANEKLAHKVFACFRNNFVVNGLGRLLDELLNEDIDMLAAICVVAGLCVRRWLPR
jgi:hypothetical protein